MRSVNRPDSRKWREDTDDKMRSHESRIGKHEVRIEEAEDDIDVLQKESRDKLTRPLPNTTLHFQKIPTEKLGTKIWKSLVGVVMGVAGYYLLKNEMGPTVLGTVFVGAGGFLVAGDVVRAALPLGKDIVSFVAWAIKKIKSAIKNGD